MLGKRIEELRKKKGLTQTELGKVFGFRDSTISQYETGKRNPDNDTLQKIADYFGVSTDYLLGRSENKKPIDFSPLENFINHYETLSKEEQKEAIKRLIDKALENDKK